MEGIKMVAKSYQGLEIVGDVYVSSGRTYVQVRTKKGTLKQVRWYSDAEYAKMYPDEAKRRDKNDPYFKTQKEVLGFGNGYITIFKGNTYENKDYFKFGSARYTRWWGWYFVSTEELPTDIPEDVEPVKLPWELVGNEDGFLKPENEVISAVETLLYEPDVSEYQGNIGDKLNIVVSVEKAILLNGYYGPSTMHILRDYSDNCYVWTTSARNWSEGTEHHIVGTVKEHKQYKGIKQTILTRCREKK